MDTFSEVHLFSLVRLIKKECLIKNMMIPVDRFILTLVKIFLSLLEETQGVAATKSITEFVLNFLRIQNNLSVITLNLQIYFTATYKGQLCILKKRSEDIEQSIKPLLNSIHLIQTIKSREDLDQLYHLISCYAMLISGLGDPSDSKILKEVVVILKSIMSSKELGRLTSKSILSKEIQLKDLCRIVTGIIIYNNKYGNRKVENSCDLMPSLSNAINLCYTISMRALHEIEECISSLLQKYTKLYDVTDCFSVEEKCVPYSETEEMYIENEHYVKSYIIFLHQLSYYFRFLTRNADLLKNDFKLSASQLQINLLRVRKTIKFRTAVPVVEIYPLFKEISRYWDKIQDLLVLSNDISKIITELYKFFKTIPKSRTFKPNKIKQEITDVPLINFSSNCVHDISHPLCELINPRNVKCLHDIIVEYGGFCPVTFVETNGLLVTGIREYGLVKYSNHYFCFATSERLYKFFRNPNMYIRGVTKLVLIWPEAFSLLCIERICERKNINIRSNTICNNSIHRKDAEIQTEMHTPSFNNYHHYSSVWLMNKHSLRLSNLRKCVTHSVQTEMSNFRKNVSVQT